MQLTSVQQSGGEQKDKYTLSFVGKGNYSRHLQEWYVTQKPTIKTDLKEIFTHNQYLHSY